MREVTSGIQTTYFANIDYTLYRSTDRLHTYIHTLVSNASVRQQVNKLTIKTFKTQQ